MFEEDFKSLCLMCGFFVSLCMLGYWFAVVVPAAMAAMP